MKNATIQTEVKKLLSKGTTNSKTAKNELINYNFQPFFLPAIYDILTVKNKMYIVVTYF